MSTREWREAHPEHVRAYWRAWYYHNREQANAAKRKRRFLYN